MIKPAQHILTTTIITIDGVLYKIPRGYVSADGKTVMRDDRPEIDRLVPREILPFEGGFAISEGCHCVPLRKVKK